MVEIGQFTQAGVPRADAMDVAIETKRPDRPAFLDRATNTYADVNLYPRLTEIRGKLSRDNNIDRMTELNRIANELYDELGKLYAELESARPSVPGDQAGVKELPAPPGVAVPDATAIDGLVNRIADINDLLVDVVLPQLPPEVEEIDQWWDELDLGNYGARYARDRWHEFKGRVSAKRAQLISEQKRLERNRAVIEGRVARNNRLNNPPPGAPNPFAANIARIEAADHRLHDAIHHIDHILLDEPEEEDYRMMSILRHVAHVEHEGHGIIASPQAFRDYIYKYIDSVCEDVDKAFLGWKAVAWHMEGDTHITVLDMAKYFLDKSRDPHSPLAGYWKEFPTFFAYGNWRFASRRHKVGVINNYDVPADIRNALDKENKALTQDGNFQDIWNGALNTNFDGLFETPAIEMARISTVIYEEIGVIGEIKKQDYVSADERAQILQNVGNNQAAANTEINRLQLERKIQALQARPNLQFLKLNTNVSQNAQEAQEIAAYNQQREQICRFILNNVDNFIPWEENSKATMLRVRKAIQLLAAGDIIRNPELAAQANEDTAQYRELLNDRLVLKFDQQGYGYVLDGIELKDPDPTVQNDPNADPQRQDILKRLKKMQQYGQMMEGGAHDLFWPTYQAFHADTIARGYPGKMAALSTREPYALRYAYRNYAGAPRVAMARRVRRLLSTVYQQSEIADPSDTNPDIKKRAKITLMEAFRNPNLDMKRKFDPTTQFNQGASYMVGEILKRAYEADDVLEKGLFDYSKVRLDELGGGDKAASKILEFKNSMLVMRKKFQYLNEPYDLGEPGVIEMLIDGTDYSQSLAQELRDSINRGDKDAKAIAVGRISTAQMLELLEYSIAKEIGEHDSAFVAQATKHDNVEANIKEYIDLKKGKGDKVGIEGKDFTELWDFLVSDGEIMTSIYTDQNGAEQVQPFVWEQPNGSDLDDDQKLQEIEESTDIAPSRYPMARRLKRAIAAGFAYPVGEQVASKEDYQAGIIANSIQAP